MMKREMTGGKEVRRAVKDGKWVKGILTVLGIAGLVFILSGRNSELRAADEWVKKGAFYAKTYCGSEYIKTDEFEIYLFKPSNDLLRRVKVSGKEIIKYVSTVLIRPLSTVSGDMVWLRRSPTQADYKSAIEEGNYVTTFSGVFSDEAIPKEKEKPFAGEPVVSYKGKNVITPNGKITVHYELEWLKKLKWRDVSICPEFIFSEVTGRKCLVKFASGVIKEVVFPEKKDWGKLIKGEKRKVEWIEIETSQGLVQITDIEGSFAYICNNGFLVFTPECYKRKKTIPIGTKATLGFTIQLPVKGTGEIVLKTKINLKQEG